jgi:hypothetical protein
MLRWLRKRPRSVRPCDYKMMRGDRAEYRQAAGADAATLSGRFWRPSPFTRL